MLQIELCERNAGFWNTDKIVQVLRYTCETFMGQLLTGYGHWAC